jgi:hypothetical protein
MAIKTASNRLFTRPSILELTKISEDPWKKLVAIREVDCVQIMIRIAIFHPEGNLLNNPNLSGIVEKLCENGCIVDIYSHRREHYQGAPCVGSTFIYRENIFTYYLDIRIPYFHRIRNLVKRTQIECFSEYVIKKKMPNFVIGIDADGIKQAYQFASEHRLPYGLISYEMLFHDEIGIDNKTEEIQACKSIAFAVSQDNIRAKMLSEENNIGYDKIIIIPNSGYKVNMATKNYYLHNLLNIQKEKNIALFMGSIADWTCIDEVIECSASWPDDWVLVIHHRYENKNLCCKLKEHCVNRKNIFFSTKPVNSFYALNNIIKSSSVGIVGYKPTYQDMNTGKNIKYVGLSSGKFSTFMQNGIPVIINNVALLSDIVRKNRLGLVCDDGFVMPKTTELNSYSENCYNYFLNDLDLDKNIGPLIAKIRNTI